MVHEAHGIGRYRGLETVTVGGITSEYLCIEYADGDLLYVPVASLHLVTRYTGAEADSAPLHKLGSQQWLKARRKAAEKVHDVAAELLEIQARRSSRPGHSFSIDYAQLRAFEQGFPFEETPDQRQCIEAVLADMASDQAMDRLVCGDVGFGKTEVAMRAAFVAVAAEVSVMPAPSKVTRNPRVIPCNNDRSCAKPSLMSMPACSSNSWFSCRASRTAANATPSSPISPPEKWTSSSAPTSSSRATSASSA